MPEAAIRELRLARPQQRNALDEATIARLTAELAAAVAEPAVRCIVVTADGDHFCAGADIGAYRDEDLAGAKRLGVAARELLTAIAAAPLPVIAAVRGVALGGGFELVLACDLVVADRTAQFALPEVGLGLLPGWGGTQRLGTYLGPGRVRELIFTGRRLSADEAHAAGIVTRLADVGELDGDALALAGELVARPRAALAAIKRAVAATAPAPAGFALEAALLDTLFVDADGREGVAAFLEKRPPRFGATP